MAATWEMFYSQGHYSKMVKINFADFWAHFDKQDNYFINLLRKRFNVEISDNPEFLIYSCYGEDHLKYNCHRIFYNGENEKVNWHACDFAFSFDYDQDNNNRHYRLPNWVLYGDPGLLTRKDLNPQQILKGKVGFCNMVVSNPHSEKRIRFFHKLSEYKKVDSGGRVLNNVGGPIANKREFIRKYKFSIAFENSSAKGYTTEKLFEPMLENSIPIYWGNPEVHRDFNTRSFINYHDFKNENEVIDRIIELDTNDALYLETLAQPWYKNNVMPDYLKEENILSQFDFIFSTATKRKPVAQTQNILYSFNRFIRKIDYKLNGLLQYRKPFR